MEKYLIVTSWDLAMYIGIHYGHTDLITLLAWYVNSATTLRRIRFEAVRGPDLFVYVYVSFPVFTIYIDPINASAKRHPLITSAAPGICANSPA